MNITAGQVKDLREKTGAGMLDCKKALEECNGDIDKSIDYLREKGITKAAKKQDRIAAEGLSNIYVNGNKAIIIEINSETDFVAKNIEFKELVEKLSKVILDGESNDVDSALNIDVEGTKVSDIIAQAIAKIGEKISLRRFSLVKKTDDQTFGAYIHMGGKISSLVVINNASEEIAKDIAMQAAAMRPLYATIEEISAEDIEHEKSVIKEQIINEGKKTDFIDKIIDGRINKFYEDTVLLEQAFIKESSQKVKDYLSMNNCSLKSMIRYEVGEGMEKRSDNFAEEVMGQIK